MTFSFFLKIRASAEAGLRRVIELLDERGLSLSDDEKKKPEILDATDENRIVSRLDSIKYGIFEELKFVDYLEEERLAICTMR